MNLARQAEKPIKQQPTYHIAPNFTTRPFPDGPFELGTIVENLTDFYPLNDGANNRVPIPEEQRYTDVKEKIKANIRTSRSGEASILAKFLDRSIGGNMGLKGQKTDEDVYEIERLVTVYFFPQLSYLNKCLQLTDIKEYLKVGKYEDPIYLITGLKIAQGATLSSEHGRGYDGSVGIHAVAPGTPITFGIEAKAGASAESAVSSSFSKPTDFVLGIQVQKLYHKRKLWSGKKAFAAERVVKKAMLVDNEESQKMENVGNEADFVLEDLDLVELEGFKPWVSHDSNGQEEAWLLPSDVL